MTPTPELPDKQTTANISVNQQAANVSGKLTGVEIQGNVGTITGFGEQAVLRLVIAVAVVVFLTAGCFFSGGLVLGVGAFAALNRPATVGPALAQSMQTKLNAINGLQSGQRFQTTITEDEFHSYLNLVAGASFGLKNPSVRILDEPGKFIVYGNADAVSSLPVAATFRLTTGTNPIAMESSAINILPFGNAPFGWVAVPASVVGASLNSLDTQLFKNVRFESFANSRENGEPVMNIRGVKR